MPEEIAEYFNDYFINDIKPTTKENDTYPKTLTYKNCNSMFMKPTNPYEVDKIIKALKHTNSTGYDNINTKIIKRVSHIIAPVLSSIINLCLEHGIFPSKLKITVINPLFKRRIEKI